jgi:hypothetical protein
VWLCLLLGEQDEQALGADEYLGEEADEAEPDDGRDVDAAERRDDLPGDGEEGLRWHVRQHLVTGSLGYHDMTIRGMKRNPNADSAGPATPATVAGSRSPSARYSSGGPNAAEASSQQGKAPAMAAAAVTRLPRSLVGNRTRTLLPLSERLSRSCFGRAISSGIRGDTVTELNCSKLQGK